MNAADVMQFLVGGGVLTGAIETFRWFLGGGRGKAKIDNAKVVEAMALDLLKPLNDQVRWASGEVENLRSTLSETQINLSTVQHQLIAVQHEMESLIIWSLAAKALLDEHNIPYPATPSVMKPKGQ
jgi:hypothetical protein